MNASTFRGFAALTLLCLLPRLHALTIVQTTTFTHSQYVSGHGLVRFGGQWTYQPFDPSLGTLQSVLLESTTTALVSAYDINFYYSIHPPIPQWVFEVTPSVSLTTQLSNSDGSISYGSANASDDSIGELIKPWPLNQGVSFSDTLTTTHSFVFTTAPDLARFSGFGTWPAFLPRHDLLLNGEAYGYPSYHGGASIDGSTTVTLTYNYVPDAGNYGALFGLSICALAVARHRIRRRGR